MLFRFLFTICVFFAILATQAYAQPAPVPCLENYRGVCRSNKSCISSLERVCELTKPPSQEGYAEGIKLLSNVLETMDGGSIAIEMWKEALEESVAEYSRSKTPVAIPDPAPVPTAISEPNTVQSPNPEPISVPAAVPAPASLSTPPPATSPAPVPITFGACELPDGTCYVLAKNICAMRKGTFKGDDTKCEDQNPSSGTTHADQEARMGACCPDNPDEPCTMTREEDCRGRWVAGVSCESRVCDREDFDEKPSTDISQTEMDRLGAKARRKVEQFKAHIDIISNKSIESYTKDKSIDQAVGLFLSEESLVTVSNVTTGQTATRKIRVYLNRLKMLPYTQVKIEWTNFKYVSKFTKGNDGKYYGYVEFEQTFTGLKDGIPLYRDRITRKQEVVIERYTKIIEGKAVQEWDVFLGDMGIVQR